MPYDVFIGSDLYSDLFGVSIILEEFRLRPERELDILNLGHQEQYLEISEALILV